MNTSKVLRTALFVAALGAALAAQAVQITLSSKGLDDYSSGNAVVSETLLSQTGGYGPLSTLNYVIDLTTYPVFSGVYANGADSLDVDFTLLNFVSVGTVQSGYGTWTATGGTGSYAGATGAGAFGLTFTFLDGTTTAISQMVFAGDVQAVPEPSALAALGLGGLALLRRRKRA